MNQTDAQISPVCIAGAHRSGTSMLARLLHEAGLELGPERDLMPAQADNPDGFWENLRFVAINDEVLSELGGAWDLPPAATEDFEDERLGPVRLKAKVLIKSFAGGGPWGWKDPRNSLTLPFWKELLSPLKVVLMVRNPLEVAYSMHKRNGTSYAFGLRLWEIYNRRLLATAAKNRRLISIYDSFFSNPEAELRRIASFIGLPGDRIEAAISLVARDRRHTSFTVDQLVDARVAPEIIELYCKLVAANPGMSTTGEKGGFLPGAPSRLRAAVPEKEEVREELATLRGTKIEHERLQDELPRLRQIAQLEGRIQELQASVATRDSELSEATKNLGMQLTELESLRERLQQNASQAEGLRERLAQSSTESEALHEQLRQRESETRALRERLAQSSTESEALHEQLRQRESEIAAVHERLQQEEGETESLRARLIHVEQLLNDRSLSLAERERRVLDLTERLRQQLNSAASLGGFLDRTAAAAARLRESGRWKLSNPIPTLRHSLFGRPLFGPGDLERIVKAYADWKHAHPEMTRIDGALAELAMPETPAEPSLPPPPYVPPIPTKPIEFTAHDEVEVSIIIPVFNQFAYTRACLDSIQKHTADEQFEVIVMDDCSTDATADKISQVPGIVYVRNEANAGFLASCNRGAAVARGRFLLFLNNDTEVRPGWLSALLRVFKLRPDAGLVGAKLIYADGKLQEAGGIIWQDASGANYGKWDNPDKPAYNYLREVDYCSGACILTPRALFEELGGFDPALAPAYYEDTDLAFKIREAGLRVYYQPQAVVVHHEGTTSGTSTESGEKRYQVVNQVKFRTKWQEALQRHGDGQRADLDRSKDRGVAKRVLVVDTRILCPDQDSGSLRMLNLLQIFQELGFKVTFLPENLQRPTPYTERMQELGIECLYEPYVSEVGDFLRQRSGEFDLIVLSRMEIGAKMLAACRAATPSTPVIFDTVDLHFLRGEREAELARSDEKRQAAAETRQSELAIASRCDAVIVVSPFEKEILEAELPESCIAIVSNIHETHPSTTPYTGRRDFVFIGGFEHPPNVDAMEWFCAEIMPRIVQQIPEARLHIIGSKMPDPIRALASPHIFVHGYVEDVQSFFDSCLLSIAPLRYGAGVKGKINQSMSFGVPVVSTSMGAEGMHLEHERNILIADEPKDFARQVVRLHRDPALWQRLSEAGPKNIEEHFSFAAARMNLENLLRCLKVWPEVSNKKTSPPGVGPVEGDRPAVSAFHA